MSRLPAPEPDSLSPEQRRVHDAIVSGSRGAVRGPFSALLHVPELADRVQHLGEYLRVASSCPRHLSELSILLVARHWNCHYEWTAHEPHAKRSGIAQDVIDAIKQRRRPAHLRADESMVYDFTTELLEGGKVTDVTYNRVLESLERRGAIELTAFIGYYSMIAMTLLAHEIPLPDGKYGLMS
jgi:4-carboxymuconolactone decarboxylase